MVAIPTDRIDWVTEISFIHILSVKYLCINKLKQNDALIYSQIACVLLFKYESKSYDCNIYEYNSDVFYNYEFKFVGMNGKVLK